jgi:hypothetical protein
MSTEKKEDELTKFIKKSSNHEIKMLELLFIEFTRVKESKGKMGIPGTLYTIMGILEKENNWPFALPKIAMYPKYLILKWIRLASYKYKEYLSARGKNNENSELHAFSEIYRRHKSAKPPYDVTKKYPQKSPPNPMPPSAKPYGRYSNPRGVKPPVYNERDSFQGRIVPRR